MREKTKTQLEKLRDNMVDLINTWDTFNSVVKLEEITDVETKVALVEVKKTEKEARIHANKVIQLIDTEPLTWDDIYDYTESALWTQKYMMSTGRYLKSIISEFNTNTTGQEENNEVN